MEHESTYSLPQLEKRRFSNVSRLPVSLRILLASLKKAAGKSISTRNQTHSVREELSEKGTPVMTTETDDITFDLLALDSELRKNDAYLREGHTARTLVRKPDLRVVLVVMQAGARMAEHRADETASVHALSGHVRLRLSEKVVELAAGQLLVIERGLRHDVEAVAESAFLLTLGWRG